MADDWLIVDSSNIDSVCGEEAGETLAEALDDTDAWAHNTNEEHWFILDLGQTYTIKKVRGRSNSGEDPTLVDVYVSDSKVSWGTAVATNIATWQDTSSFVEIDSTDKDGRYVKVVIKDTEHVNNWITFGDQFGGFESTPPGIFDVYGDVPAGGISIPVAMRHYRNLRET